MTGVSHRAPEGVSDLRAGDRPPQSEGHSDSHQPFRVKHEAPTLAGCFPCLATRSRLRLPQVEPGPACGSRWPLGWVRAGGSRWDCATGSMSGPQTRGVDRLPAALIALAPFVQWPGWDTHRWTFSSVFGDRFLLQCPGWTQTPPGKRLIVKQFPVCHRML